MSANMRQMLVQNAKTLNSWKEVAAYLGRGVRTVQRWEAELQLPVHRMGTSERSPVFAFRGELDNWIRRQAEAAGNSPAIAPKTTKSDRIARSLAAVDQSARLANQTLRLIETQQASAKSIAEQLDRMRLLVPAMGKVYSAGLGQPHSSAPVRRK
jgi:hypothetical protein